MNLKILPKDRILDISLNLARVGNWSADSYDRKKDLIRRFLNQTENYVSEIRIDSLSPEVKTVFTRFKIEFDKLKNQEISLENKNEWAEKALTWANILQHRAKLA